MPQSTPLIAVVVVGFVLAFVLGLVAHRLRASPLVGYLLAGVAVGPFTPGLVADQHLADQLADIGVILLMFAVGWTCLVLVERHWVRQRPFFRTVQGL
jgi:CPA2 family monovalent cation:H+ antiporter-2